MKDTQMKDTQLRINKVSGAFTNGKTRSCHLFSVVYAEDKRIDGKTVGKLYKCPDGNNAVCQTKCGNYEQSANGRQRAHKNGVRSCTGFARAAQANDGSEKQFRRWGVNAMKISVVRCLSVAFLLAVGTSVAYGETIAASGTSSTSYSTTSNTALDFYVYSNITVDYLGVYDPGGDSLTGPVTVSIYAAPQFGAGAVASYTFEPDTAYILVGNDVFAAISPVTLTDYGYNGQGGYGNPYGLDTYFGNPANGSTGTGQTLNTFASEVAYGGEYSDNNPFNDGAPTGSNPVADTTFNAGTFATGTIPDGGTTLALLGLAVAGLAGLRRKLRK